MSSWSSLEHTTSCGCSMVASTPKAPLKTLRTRVCWMTSPSMLPRMWRKKLLNSSANHHHQKTSKAQHPRAKSRGSWSRTSTERPVVSSGRSTRLIWRRRTFLHHESLLVVLLMPRAKVVLDLGLARVPGRRISGARGRWEALDQGQISIPQTSTTKLIPTTGVGWSLSAESSDILLLAILRFEAGLSFFGNGSLRIPRLSWLGLPCSCQQRNQEGNLWYRVAKRRGAPLLLRRYLWSNRTQLSIRWGAFCTRSVYWRYQGVEETFQVGIPLLTTSP